jgi:hypothetical protein
MVAIFQSRASVWQPVSELGLTMSTNSHSFGIILAIALLSVPILSSAAEDADNEQDDVATRPVMTVDEIARELSNPVTALRSIVNEIEFRTFQGDLRDSSDQTNLVYRFSPSFPFKLKNGKNILVRATIPMDLYEPEWRVNVDDPIFEEDRDYTEFLLRQSPQITDDTGHFRSAHGHLSDFAYDVAYGGVSDHGFISMYGIAGVFSSSQNISGSRDQTLLGPEVAFGKSADWGVIGAWLTHLVDVTGDSSFNTSETTIDLFFSYGLGNGWQIISNPTILYDWEADSGNELLLPLGGGVAKTTRFGRTPVRMEFEVQNFLVSPDRFGPEWLLSFRITPVIGNMFE